MTNQVSLINKHSVFMQFIYLLIMFIIIINSYHIQFNIKITLLFYVILIIQISFKHPTDTSDMHLSGM